MSRNQDLRFTEFREKLKPFLDYLHTAVSPPDVVLYSKNQVQQSESLSEATFLSALTDRLDRPALCDGLKIQSESAE